MRQQQCVNGIRHGIARPWLGWRSCKLHACKHASTPAAAAAALAAACLPAAAACYCFGCCLRTDGRGWLL
jgi:hypothetical protein